MRSVYRRRKRYSTGTEVSEHLTFLEGEDSMQLAAHRGGGGAAAVLHPCHEHRQLLCSDRGGGGSGSIIGVTQSPTYTRCTHRSRDSTTPFPLPPLPHPLCCDASRIPESGQIACACALLWSEALYSDGGSQHRSLDSLQAFDSDRHNHHHQQQHFCCDSLLQPPQRDSCCCCCCGRGHPLKEPDSLSTTSSAADRCVDFAARLSVRGVLGLRESRSPIEDSARSSRGRPTGQTACPHRQLQPSHPPALDGDWTPFEGQGGAKKAAQGVHSSVTSVRDVTVASGSGLTDDAENGERRTNHCNNSHVTKADDAAVEPSNPDLVSAAFGTQQQQLLNGYG